MTATEPNTEYRPATDLLIAHLAETLAEMRAHQHPERGGDLFCLNLTSYLGERMGPVLRRLADEQTAARQWQERHTALADEFAAEIDRFKPVTYDDGDQLYMHTCRNVEWWNEDRQGPVNEQGCDACESGPYPGGWRPVYVREDGAS
ncbi:hypothetical protein [Micromonospora globbae]|uniref:hypothetical protein n=1 Tax=Micromonospora globbae TaxID=1894969 RepID=UPI00343B4C43